MKEDIYEPLSRYRDEFKRKFSEISADTFEKLVAKSGVDISANRKTIEELNKVQAQKADLESQDGIGCFFSVVLTAAAALSAIHLISLAVIPVEISKLSFSLDCNLQDSKYVVLSAVILAVSLILLFAVVLPERARLSKEIRLLHSKIRDLKLLAWQQMEKLNALFSWELLPEMIEKCVPKLQFDPYFHCGRLDDLRDVFGWNDSFNRKISILFAHSGVINDNPFVICKYRTQEWGSEIYSGSKVITYTERVQDSNGKYRTVIRTQTLVATVEKPKPVYLEKSAVIYGNDAAPKLTFSRSPSSYSGNDGFFSNLSKKMELKSLEKFSRNLTDDSDFTMMSNREFEVLFHADDRNNEIEFRVLFTPLAQQQMVDLLNDKTHGYGDDFYFEKKRKINILYPEHLNSADVDVDPEQFKNYSIDDMRNFFATRTNEYFRLIYFALAPLLTIPVYQQTRSSCSIDKVWGSHNISFWEVESFLNYLGRKQFQHPESKTANILKASDCNVDAGGNVSVTAYGFKTVQRVTVVPVYGRDNRFHDVPVKWIEYLPVSRQSEIKIGIADKSSADADKVNIRRQIYVCR